MPHPVLICIGILLKVDSISTRSCSVSICVRAHDFRRNSNGCFASGTRTYGDQDIRASKACDDRTPSTVPNTNFVNIEAELNSKRGAYNFSLGLPMLRYGRIST
ncbi:b3dcdf31-8b8e-40b4-b12e-b4382f609ccd-CDS [Sclerotinia trifoliorum]|uniref:B3dcdf31-8b8e-40b4-b12e-b4382f609ccd-CDS n=1 Tax=Sclerotinia trifoliorum TaxID=28548 RepID=A0A8H2VTD9_9HELO|nr:b3dcdf31-8b8e-40b4-b12e-b4382f609ccd-CDS [Sclerotinia trifoliorum]